LFHLFFRPSDGLLPVSLRKWQLPGLVPLELVALLHLLLLIHFLILQREQSFRQRQFGQVGMLV
jgi:hypothetical protein